MEKYIKKNPGPLALRAARGGLLIVLDGNMSEHAVGVENVIRAAMKSFRIDSHKSFLRVAHQNACHANPELDESFRGIERYLPTDIVLAGCQTAGVALSSTPCNGQTVYTLSPRFKALYESKAKRLIIEKFCTKAKYVDSDWEFIKSIFLL